MTSTDGVPRAPVAEVAEFEKRTRRPHPLTPLIRGWLLLVAIVLAVGREFLPDGRDDGGLRRQSLGFLFGVAGAAVLLAVVAGFVSWWSTHFVIDDREVRVDTGVLWRRSTRVGFARLQSVDIVQPFAARPFGLVELRIDAGGGDRPLVLRYLRRAHADGLRTFLLARAHGQNRSVTEDPGPAASAFTDLGSDDRPLVTVGASRLVGSFLLSTEWLLIAGALGLVVGVGWLFGVLPFLVPALIPAALAAVSLIGRRVLSMFRFTLAESPRGLRVTRGLTNLSSQSVPLNRVQGIRITQSLLWRPFGWYRIDVDVLGYRSEREGDSGSPSTVLLPVADRGEVAVVVQRVLPGLDLAAVPLTRPPRRARLLRWFDHGMLRYGWDDRVVVTDHGLLVWTRDIVPHVKTQSVRIRQGPLQRWCRLADVHLDTTPGPVDAVARQLDVAAARAMALGQPDRSRGVPCRR